MIKKIAIIGPESTGKSSLCEQLGQHYNTPWVPEYARAYLLKYGMNYSYEDLLVIAQGQLALEDKCLDELRTRIQTSHSPLTINHLPIFGDSQQDTHPTPLFIDTNMYVMKVWCEFVFSKCHDWILHQIAQRKYDLYLLCDTDLPWVKDELREYPDLESRQKLYHIYKDIMINQPVPWVEIHSNYEQRFVKAVVAVDELLAAR